MLPRIDHFSKKENYPHEENYKQVNNILKLKLIRQFLQKDNSDNTHNLQTFTQRKSRNKENFTLRRLRRNRVGSALGELETLISPKNDGKYLNGSISKSGRNLRLNELYDLQNTNTQYNMSEQLKRSLTNCKVR